MKNKKEREREIPDIDPPKDAQSVYFLAKVKRCKTIQWWNDSLSTNGVGELNIYEE